YNVRDRVGDPGGPVEGDAQFATASILDLHGLVLSSPSRVLAHSLDLHVPGRCGSSIGRKWFWFSEARTFGRSWFARASSPLGTRLCGMLINGCLTLVFELLKHPRRRTARLEQSVLETTERRLSKVWCAGGDQALVERLAPSGQRKGRDGQGARAEVRAG